MALVPADAAPFRTVAVGRLGHEQSVPSVEEPLAALGALEGRPVSKVACGPYHAAVVVPGNPAAVLTWGRGALGPRYETLACALIWLCSVSSCVAYATVGTGVGVGLVVNGAPVHGLLHPEAGHACVPRYPGDDFAGHNPSLNCPGWAEVEAMCASGALAKRAGLRDASGLKDLGDDHPVWDVAAHYLAALCANLILVVSPEKIVLSGGVMLRASLFPKIREKTV